MDVREARLRSNPRFRLVPFDRLPGTEIERFKSLSEDPDFFGILAPPGDSVLPVKSVSRDAALLFLQLREPACLPHLLQGLFGAGAGDRVRQLILDGVFEIELDGQFVSGAAALAQLGDRESNVPTSTVTRLSEDAIAYAAALELLSVQEVATRLYLFNAVPSTPALQRRFADDDRLCAYLFESGSVAHRLRSRWRMETLGESWLAWGRMSAAREPGYKLYVSPTLEHLPRIFEAAVDTFGKVGCTYFKMGRGAFGVLRPDKLVAYFRGLDTLLEAAGLIQIACAGAVAQGVPFTAPIDAQGLMSWGMDPPRFEQVFAWQQVQSWRQWLTGRIASYTLAAREAGTDVHSFVRNRIQLDGVDPSTWNPDLAIWRGPTGTEQEVP